MTNITTLELRKILANKTEEDFIKIINTFPIRQPRENEHHFIEYEDNLYLNKRIVRELTKIDRIDCRDIPGGTICAEELELFIKNKNCKKIKYHYKP